jgi:hypothetical protein
MRLLRRERHGARSAERLREPRQHRKVGVKAGHVQGHGRGAVRARSDG